MVPATVSCPSSMVTHIVHNLPYSFRGVLHCTHPLSHIYFFISPLVIAVFLFNSLNVLEILYYWRDGSFFDNSLVRNEVIEFIFKPYLNFASNTSSWEFEYSTLWRINLLIGGISGGILGLIRQLTPPLHRKRTLITVISIVAILYSLLVFMATFVGRV